MSEVLLSYCGLRAHCYVGNRHVCVFMSRQAAESSSQNENSLKYIFFFRGTLMNCKKKNTPHPLFFSLASAASDVLPVPVFGDDAGVGEQVCCHGNRGRDSRLSLRGFTVASRSSFSPTCCILQPATKETSLHLQRHADGTPVGLMTNSACPAGRECM